MLNDTRKRQAHAVTDLASRLKAAKVGFENISVATTPIIFELEKFYSLADSILKRIPDGFLQPLRGFNLTRIYRVERKKTHKVFEKCQVR